MKRLKKYMFYVIFRSCGFFLRFMGVFGSFFLFLVCLYMSIFRLGFYELVVFSVFLLFRCLENLKGFLFFLDFLLIIELKRVELCLFIFKFYRFGRCLLWIS